MAKVAPILQTFDAGELSPLLAARTDLAKYPNGCAVLENFLPTVQGPLVRRGGTQYIDTAKGRSWLIPFQVSERISYMLAFSHKRIDVYADRGVLVDNGTPVVISTPYDAADLLNADGTCALHITQSADVMYLFHRDYAPMKLIRTGAATFTLGSVTLSGGPFDNVNPNVGITVSASANLGTVTLTASHDIFTPDHVDTLFYLESADRAVAKPWAVYQEITVGELRRVENRVYVCTATGPANSEGAPVTGNQTPVHTEGKAWDGDGKPIANDSRGSIGAEWEFLHAGYGTMRITGYTDAQHVTGTVVERLPDDVAIGNVPWSVSAQHNVTGLVHESDTGVRVTLPVVAVQSGGWVQLSGTLIQSHGFGTTPFSIDGTYQVSDVQGNSFRISATIPSVWQSVIQHGQAAVLDAGQQFNAKPTHKWAHSLFSAINGWPEHGIFWRNRLVLVSGRRVAMSVAGDFENFSERVNGQVQTDAAIIQTLNARQINRVVWAAASDELILGTDGDEWVLGPMQPSQAVGPDNIIAERRTTYGSRAVMPVEIGGKILFVQGAGRVLRDYEFRFESDNYASTDTTKLNPQILASGVVDMAYQREPDTVIWAVRADGVLVGCTYDQEPGRSDIYAWHRHTLVNGFVEAVQTCPAPNGSGDDVWLIVRRDIEGQTVRYVEVLRRPLDDNAPQAESFYIDSGLTYRGNPASTIAGLDHLNGQTVHILADGAVHPDRVVQQGTIALEWQASIVHVGLPAPCAMSSMGIEAGSQNGTSQGKLKKLSNVICRVYRTLGGNLGASRQGAQPVHFRRSDQPMDAPPELFTGDMLVAWSGGSERDARIWYTNDQPLPVTLLAFMPMVATQDDR